MRRLFLATISMAALVTLPLFASAARADVEGPCAGNAQAASGTNANVNDIDSPGNAFKVKEDDKVQIAMRSTQGVNFSSHRIQLEFGGVRWTVSEQSDNDDQWTGTVNVDDYATYGVGLYKVIGRGTLENGQECTGIAYVEVEGNPLTTAAGAGAVGATALGAIIVLAAGAAAGAKRPEESVVREVERIAGARQPSPEDVQRQLESQRSASEQASRSVGLFAFLALPGLLLAGASMAAGGGTPGPQGRLRIPRLRWRPRFSFLGMLGGLLLGADIMVLLQQYAILFPALEVVIYGLVLGLALGIIIPSLRRFLAVRGLNGRLARAERQINANLGR